MIAKNAMEAAEILPRLKATMDTRDRVARAWYSMETQCDSDLVIHAVRPCAGVLDKETWEDARGVVVRSLERREAAMRARLRELGVGCSADDLTAVKVSSNIRGELERK